MPPAKAITGLPSESKRTINPAQAETILAAQSTLPASPFRRFRPDSQQIPQRTVTKSTARMNFENTVAASHGKSDARECIKYRATPHDAHLQYRPFFANKLESETIRYCIFARRRHLASGSIAPSLPD